MTEDEAKKKRCCVIQLNIVSLSALEENPKLLEQCARCIGSGCMAWQWESFYPKGKALQEVVSEDCPESVENCVWVLSGDKTTWGLFPKTGYCGMAGRP